jgi:hypothetical protein
MAARVSADWIKAEARPSETVACTLQDASREVRARGFGITPLRWGQAQPTGAIRRQFGRIQQIRGEKDDVTDHKLKEPESSRVAG